jgi:predicted aconitase with swiveling domain
MLTLERRAIDAFVRLGVAMTDTCINYQTIQAPTRGEHLAFGDTGVVIYSNAICGARSNFEGGPSALSAGLTGRTPRYGFHLDAQRQATVRFRVDTMPKSLNEWGALGGVIGASPATTGRCRWSKGSTACPGSDAMKHFGAAMASFGSIALFHLVGITPEAMRLDDVGGERFAGRPSHRCGRRAGAAARYATTDEVDVVVFSAPQLSLYELRRIADLCDGRRFVRPLLAVTSPQVKPDCRPLRLHRADRGRRWARCSRACASTSRMRARSRRRTAGSGSRPTARSSSTSSAATAMCRCSRRWSSVSKPPKLGGLHECGCDEYCARGPRRPTRVHRAPCDRHEGPRHRAGRARRLLGALRPRPHRRHVLAAGHKLVGQSYVGKVLVLDTAKGGVASAWMLREMASRGVVPLAIVFNSVNPILVQGAAFGDVTMLAGFDDDITAQVPHGAAVQIDPAARLLRVL